MGTARGVPAFVLVAVWIGFGATARADGMAYVLKTEATSTGGQVLKAVPTDQRAALIRDGSDWSLVLEPRYDRPDAGVAWLVPFAHCPTVEAADPALLAELGLVTAPLFFDVCIRSCHCEERDATCLSDLFGGGAKNAGTWGDGEDGSSVAQGDGRSPVVDVWQSGTIGNLDFVVLSAAIPADIPAWLDDNGYDSPAELAAFVTDHADDYGCYFAARLGRPAGEHDVFPAVAFRLDPADPPSYPLQLTRMGVAEDQTLGLTLYVVNPADRYDDGSSTLVVPANFEALPLACDGADADTYAACLDQALADAPSAMAVTFHDALVSREHVFLHGWVCSFDDPEDYTEGDSWCLKSASVFTGLPETLSPVVESWLADWVRVTRYEGRLAPGALAKDLVFHVGPGSSGTSCAGDWDCAREALWNWDESVCDGNYHANGQCRRPCTYGTTDCPAGWECMESWECRPPAAATPGLEAVLEDPLPRVDAVFARFTDDCGFDCDDVCYGRVESGAVAFGKPVRPRPLVARVPVIALLVAAQLLLLWVRLRRRRLAHVPVR